MQALNKKLPTWRGVNIITLFIFFLNLVSSNANSDSVNPDYAIAIPSVYQNPFMTTNNFSEIHQNSFQTDTTSASGPGRLRGLNASLTPVSLTDSGGIAGSITFNRGGQIITIRTALTLLDGVPVTSQTLMLVDPKTLNIIARSPLPFGPKSSDGVSFSGGGYFFLNNSDQVVCVTFTQEIRIYAVDNNQFVFVKAYELRSAINNPNAILNSTLPDSAGNLWFITSTGEVGYVNTATAAIQVVTLDANEKNSKSLSSDADGRVFIVSDHALYSFTVGSAGSIQRLWRTTYDRGIRKKSGQNQQGSGTTPTAFDDFSGNKFIAIADNADPYLHVNVYDRNTGVLVAQQAVFNAQPNTSSTENSLIAANHTIFVENNFGNDTIQSTLGPRTTYPGFDRVDFDLTTDQATGLFRSRVVWSNMIIAVPSVVSKLSVGDGLIYTYAKDATGWYWAALDFNTGDIVSKSYIFGLPFGVPIGGVLANNYYGGLSIGPDQTVYAGVMGGFVSWRAQSR